jgi:hypothetical protein
MGDCVFRVFCTIIRTVLIGKWKETPLKRNVMKNNSRVLSTFLGSSKNPARRSTLVQRFVLFRFDDVSYKCRLKNCALNVSHKLIKQSGSKDRKCVMESHGFFLVQGPNLHALLLCLLHGTKRQFDKFIQFISRTYDHNIIFKLDNFKNCLNICLRTLQIFIQRKVACVTWF